MIGSSPARTGLPVLMRRELPELASLLAFLFGTALLFRSWEFALIVTASLGFHELGHAAALTWFRLDYRIHFGIAGAWTWTQGRDRAELSHLANVYIHLAGPLFSLLLALGALALSAWWLPGNPHLLILANFSAQTGFLNLLPLGIITDGGKALRRMAASAGQSRGRRMVLLLTGATFILPGIWFTVELFQSGGLFGTVEFSTRLLGLLLIGAWLLLGVVSELFRGGLTVLPARRAMNPVQSAFTILLVWDMLALFLIVIEFTPFWLAPQYVQGALQNLSILFEWIFSLL